MIDKIEVISETDFFFDKVCYFNTGISQLQIVYKQTPAHINITQKEGKCEKKYFLIFYDHV